MTLRKAFCSWFLEVIQKLELISLDRGIKTASELSALPLMLVLALGTLFAGSQAEAQTAHFAYFESQIGSGLKQPESMCVDSAGNVFIADTGSDRVVEESPNSTGGYNQSTVVQNITAPTAVVVDGNDNLYVASDQAGYLYKETPLSGGGYRQSSVTVQGGAPYSDPAFLAVDSHGDLYISDSPTQSVYLDTPLANGSYRVSTVEEGEIKGPAGLAVDSKGNVYITGNTDGSVWQETPNSNGTYTKQLVSSGFSSPDGVALDSLGNLYVATSGVLYQETPEAGTSYKSQVIADLGSPYAVAVDHQGNLYVTDGGSSVVKLQRSGVNLGGMQIGLTSPDETLTFSIDTAGTLGAPQALTMGAPNLDFAVDLKNPGTCVSGASLTAGQTCTVNVSFTPKYAGARNGAVELTNSAGAVIATAYVYSSGTGPQIGFAPPAQSVIASGGAGYSGVAVDGSGDVYYSAPQNNTVYKETPSSSGSTQTVVAAAGLNSPGGLAVDGGGNVYIADSNNDRILKEAPNADGTYTQSVIATGLQQPQSLAVDSSGDIYVADTLSGSVLEEVLNPDGIYTQSVVVSGLSNPDGVAVDNSGNVYVAASNTLLMETPGSTGGYAQSTLLSGGDIYNDVAVDNSGNVYVADNAGTIDLVSLNLNGNYVPSVIVSNQGMPQSLAIDGSGNIYIAEANGNGVVKEDFADAPSLSFPVTNTGEQSSSQTVSLENLGNETLMFPAPTTGYNPSISANFIYDNASTCRQATASLANYWTLAPGVSCTLAIDFVPQSTGAFSGSVVLTDNNLNAAAPSYASQAIELNGTTIPLAMSPVAGALPGAAMGVAYSQTFTVSQGTAPYQISLGSGSLPAGLTLSSSGVLSGTPTGAGLFTFTVTAKDANNISLSQSYTLTVTQPTLTLTANNATRMYSQPNPTFTGTVTGAIGADAFTESYTTTASVYSNVGAYPITPVVSGANLSNYSVVTNSGTLTITPDQTEATVSAPTATVAANQSVTLTISVQDLTAALNPTIHGNPTLPGSVIVYDGSNAIATLQATSLVANFAQFQLPARDLTQGSHTFTAVYQGQGNYAASTTNPTFTLTVTKPALTVTAGNVTRVYGAANPSFPGTVNGQAGGANFTESFTTSATTSSAPGTYTIVPSVTGSNLADYAVALVNGTLTITQASSAVTLTSSASSINPSQGLTLTANVTDSSSGSTGMPTGTVSFYSGSVLLGTASLSSGTADYSVAASQLNVATGAITARYSGDTNFTGSTSNAVNYAVARLSTSITLATSVNNTTANQSFTITAKVVSTALGSSAGTPSGTVTFSNSGTPLGSATLVNGVATYQVTAPIAGQTYLLTANYAGDTIFAASQSSGPLAVTVAPLSFTLALNPGSGSSGQSQTVQPGGAATYAFNITPTVGAYPGPVTFSATGLPQGATVTFSPATLAPSAGAKTITMTVQTAASATSALSATTAASHSPFERGGPILLGSLLLPLLGLRRARKSWQKRGLLVALLLLGGLAGVSTLTGCGSSVRLSGNTQPQSASYTVIISATSGGVTQSTSVNLIVS